MKTRQFEALGEVDEFDDVDVNILGSLLPSTPNSWEEAVKSSPRCPVLVFFRAMGRRYDHDGDFGRWFCFLAQPSMDGDIVDIFIR